MRFEDDDGVIVSLSPAARVLCVQFERARRGHGYELDVHLDRPNGGWHSCALYYGERNRALNVLTQLEAQFAGADKSEPLAHKLRSNIDTVTIRPDTTDETGPDLNEVDPPREEASVAEPKELVYAPLDEMAEAQIEQEPKKKRRGRPPGSRNKAKIASNSGEMQAEQ